MATARWSTLMPEQNRGNSPGHASQVFSKIIQLSPPIVCRAIGEVLYGHVA